MPSWRRRKGDAAEARARRHLEHAGLRFEAANVHSRFGELDLLMRDDTHLVVVEVRQRSHADFGGAAASVTPAKQRKLIKATEYLLTQQPHYAHLNIRFDVVAIDGDTLSWIPNAFQAF